MKHDTSLNNGKVSCVVALFLLSQVFLIISHSPLVQTLSWIILKTDRLIYDKGIDKLLEYYSSHQFDDTTTYELMQQQHHNEEQRNITDEEKERLVHTTPTTSNQDENPSTAKQMDKPFLETVYNSLDCTENDYATLFALCLLYAMASNRGIKSDIIEQQLRPKKIFISTTKDVVRYTYNTYLVEKLLYIILLSCQPSCRVRLVTLELALKLFLQLVMCDGKNILMEMHKLSIDSARTQSMALLRNFFKSEEIFLDMFEHEYCDMMKSSLNVEWLCMDSAILLPPTGTPMTGIDFTKRLPCGEVNKSRKKKPVFVILDWLFFRWKEPDVRFVYSSLYEM